VRRYSTDKADFDKKSLRDIPRYEVFNSNRDELSLCVETVGYLLDEFD